jgi:hypothetical protein
LVNNERKIGMANYYGANRTNTFKVKDVEKFKAWADTVPDIELHDRGDGCFTILGCDPDGAGYWPTERWTGENQDVPAEFSFHGELAEHLADGEVCVCIDAGHEKLRYISGNATAFDNTGKTVAVCLWDIYKLAKEAFGHEVDTAEY